MFIHVVQPGETLDSIAAQYGISVTRLIRDNGIENTFTLVQGQTLVIAYPKQTYTVMQGDSLGSIAEAFQVSVMQLLRNNPFLSDREYIYPGETLVISYDTKGSIPVNGFTNAFITTATLKKSLPFLTYLTIYNYRALFKGEIETLHDETEIIKISKAYGVAPLMLITTLTEQGGENPEVSKEILTNEEYQDKHIENLYSIMKTKGYSGINIVFNYLNAENIETYNKYILKLSKKLTEENFSLFITINLRISNVDNEVNFEKIDYSIIAKEAQNYTFIRFVWASNLGPPSPVNSNLNKDVFLSYIVDYIPPEKISVGMSLIGYDWELPYSPGFTKANSLSLESCVDLAREVGAVIRFDEISQSPYFEYSVNSDDNDIEHIVWYIDARSINSLLDLKSKYQFYGIGLWSIMTFYEQLWLVIISQYDIEKVPVLL